MKSSAFLAKTDSEKASPNNKDAKSASVPDEIIIKQEPATNNIKQEPGSSTNPTIQTNALPPNLIPVNLSPTNTILIPQHPQFQISNISPTNQNGQPQVINPSNLVPITTVPLQQPVQQLFAIPAANPTLSNNSSALQALQQSLKGRPNPLKLPLPPTNTIKQESTNSNSNNKEPIANSNSNVTKGKIPGLPMPKLQPIPQQQTLLFYQQRPQHQAIINPGNHMLPNNFKGPLTMKDEKLNENWSAKIAYAATLSSVK